jgi:type IV secretion system protein TrbL
MKRSSCFALLLVFLGLYLYCGPVFAQLPTDNTIDPISNLFIQRATLWEPVIVRYALSLFWILSGIQLTYTLIRLVTEGADGKGVITGLANRVLVIGFFNILLTNGPTWANLVVRSMQRVANEANIAAGGTAAPTPGAIFDLGLSLASKISQNVSFWSAGESIGLVISSLIIMLCFALIAASILVASCELYIIMSAGLILLGFGGADWTSVYALNYFRHVLASAFKLFIMNLIVGLGQGLIDVWVTQVQEDNGQILAMIGGSIVYLCLVKEVPTIAASMIDRPGGGSDRIIPAMAAAGAGYSSRATSNTASGAKSTVSGVAQAGYLGHQAVKAGQAAKAANGGSAAVGALRAIGSAAGQEISQSLRGGSGMAAIYGQNANFIQRMSARIHESQNKTSNNEKQGS